jgi:hypothetical protein
MRTFSEGKEAGTVTRHLHVKSYRAADEEPRATVQGRSGRGCTARGFGRRGAKAVKVESG